MSELLAPHSQRTIRAFLASPKTDQAAEDAFWDAIYPAGVSVSHETANLVASELERSQKRICDVLDGSFRPEALR